MQKIIFGLSLDASTFHEKEGVYFFGQKEFLRWLEQQLGLSWPAKNYAWLRTAFFRKVLMAFLEEHPKAFFKDSFDVDSYGTTKAILDFRDELRISNWNFRATDNMPKRLLEMSQLEAFSIEFLSQQEPKSYANHQILNNGFADRFIEVENALSGYTGLNFELTLVEPLELLPTWWQRLVVTMKKNGIRLIEQNAVDKKSDSDLNTIAQLLNNQSFTGNKVTLKGDKSLIVLRVPRDYDGLETFAYGYQNGVGELPFLIIPSGLKLPDLVFESDGMPVSGNTSVSDLRPSQQLIKLAHTFLWQPLDLGRILEFLNLPYSPLHSHLSVRLANALQERPGFDSDAWHRAISMFQASEKVEEGDKAAALFEFNFWFQRKTYFQKAKIPKSDVFDIYLHLVKWAKSRLASKSSGAIFMTIYRLSLDMLDLLDAIDEEKVSFLDLEKLTDIVIQATPATFKDREVGASNFAQDPGAIVFPFDEIIWFNFVSGGSEYISPKFVKTEIDFLVNQGVALTLPEKQNKLRKWKRYQPILLAQKRLILVVPEKVEGVYANLHPLHYELEAMIENMDVITINIKNGQALEAILPVRSFGEQVPKTSFKEGHLVKISPIEIQEKVDRFSVTELETFLHYPHNWVMRKQMKLYGSSLSKIKDINTLKGNIAHKIFEFLLKEKLHLADNEVIIEWFYDIFDSIIRAEGLPFLEYGKEPELAAYRKQLRNSILSFVHALRNNNWNVVATEETLVGKLGLNPIKGITDVVLERDGQFLIIDLKWGGKSFRETMFKNKEDIQLMLYSRYFGEETVWWDACFYIIKNGLFITRSEGLFDAAKVVSSKEEYLAVYDEMYERLLKTLEWRSDQLAKGNLELRTDAAIADLDALYGEAIFELLPLKTESYIFDDYRALLGDIL